MTTQTVSVGVDFQGSIRSKDAATRFFDNFASIYPELNFELMGEILTSERERFDRTKAIDEWQHDRGSRGVVHGYYQFEGKSPARFYASVVWHGQGTHKVWSDGIAVWFDDSFWAEKKIEEPSSKAVRLLELLTTLGSPMYGRAYHWSEFEEKGFTTPKPPSSQILKHTISLRPREGLEDIFWANYFGKPYVDIFGADTLRGVESSSKKAVGDGYLIVFGNSPFDWKRPAVRAMQDRAKQRLDHDAFFDRDRRIKPSLNLFSR